MLLAAFGLQQIDLNTALAPHLANAGVTHAVLALQLRARLDAMAYPYEQVRELMINHDFETISLIYVQNRSRFFARIAFAMGGVVEDPAAGAAAAALGGLRVDPGWPGLFADHHFSIRQGSDMGAPSVIQVQVSGVKGPAVRVRGRARVI